MFNETQNLPLICFIESNVLTILNDMSLAVLWQVEWVESVWVTSADFITKYWTLRQIIDKLQRNESFAKYCHSLKYCMQCCSQLGFLTGWAFAFGARHWGNCVSVTHMRSKMNNPAIKRVTQHKYFLSLWSESVILKRGKRSTTKQQTIYY